MVMKYEKLKKFVDKKKIKPKEKTKVNKSTFSNVKRAEKDELLLKMAQMLGLVDE